MTVTVRNDGDALRPIDITLCVLDGSESTEAAGSTPSPVDPGASVLVRFSFVDLDLVIGSLPIPLKAEMTHAR